MSRSPTSPELSREPVLFVLTAPSGTGKSTVAARVFEEVDRLAFSVSHTTRPARPRERDGVDYHFVDDGTFDEMVRAEAFAEWAHVHKRRYGTSKAEIARITGQGRDVLFDIDVQGADQLLKVYPNAVSIFMLAPSYSALAERLRGRSTESEDQIATRLSNARREIPAAARFDYVVVNRVLDDAVRDLASIIRAERCKAARNESVIRALTDEVRALDESE